MKVYGFKENEEGIMQLENTLETIQSFINGNMEQSTIADGLCIVYSGDNQSCMGKCKPNVAWFDNGEAVDVIYGNCFVCRIVNGNFSDIEESDIQTVKKILKK